MTGIPRDWARADRLLENVLSYVIDGLPDIVVIARDASGSAGPEVDLALARIGGEMLVGRISYASATTKLFSENGAFLL